MKPISAVSPAIRVGPPLVTQPGLARLGVCTPLVLDCSGFSIHAYMAARSVVALHLLKRCPDQLALRAAACIVIAIGCPVRQLDLVFA